MGQGGCELFKGLLTCEVFSASDQHGRGVAESMVVVARYKVQCSIRLWFGQDFALEDAHHADAFFSSFPFYCPSGAHFLTVADINHVAHGTRTKH
jgi:hypothetical protein